MHAIHTPPELWTHRILKILPELLVSIHGVGLEANLVFHQQELEVCS
jgi:hypothetical protein